MVYKLMQANTDWQLLHRQFYRRTYATVTLIIFLSLVKVQSEVWVWYITFIWIRSDFCALLICGVPEHLD